MLTINRLLFLSLLFIISLVSFAQTPKPVAQKFTPPKVNTFWGRQTDSAIVSKEEVLQMLPAPIKVIDGKKLSYAISSYQFLYKRKAVTEDEQTGQVRPVESIVSNLFKSTPLPKIWQTTISEQLQSGEELYYFDIIVKDEKGRLFFAPELKIKVK